MHKLITGMLFVLFLPMLAVGAEQKTVVAAADPYPPFLDPAHPRGGLSLEVLRAAFKTQGYEVVMEDVPWARAESGVKNGTYDVLLNVWETEVRRKELLFSEPFASDAIKFIALKNDPFEYNGISSLAGKVVGTIRGYGYDDEFLSSTLFVREATVGFMQNIRKLLEKRIDLTLEYEIVARTIIAKNDPTVLSKIRFVKTPIAFSDLHIASGLKNPRHKEIVEAFNRGLEVIRTDGTMGRIFESYSVPFTKKALK